jgi:hypothetical protein
VQCRRQNAVLSARVTKDSGEGLEGWEGKIAFGRAKGGPKRELWLDEDLAGQPARWQQGAPIDLLPPRASFRFILLGRGFFSNSRAESK